MVQAHGRSSRAKDKCMEQGIKGPIDHTLVREEQMEAYSGLKGARVLIKAIVISIQTRHSHHGHGTGHYSNFI